MVEKHFNIKTCLFILIWCVGCLSCNSVYKVKDGRTAFELKRYSTAIDMLKKDYSSNGRAEEKASKAYLIASSYEKLSDYARAVEWYGYAEAADYGLSATLKKAYNLKKLMRYNEAAAVFSSLESITSVAAEVKQQALLCKNFMNAKLNVSNEEVVVKLLNDSYYSDYSPVNYDDDYLVITSDRDEALGNKKYEWTGNKFSDLFIVDKESKNITRFDTSINSESNDGTPAFTKDFTKMVFTRCFNEAENKHDYCKLLYSTRVDGLWLPPIVLPFTKEDQNYGQPCFIENDSVLVFSSKDIKAEHFDLYYCEFDGSSFSEPDLLPATINTSYNEHFPTSDSDTLYFSSDVNTGMGGYDIYKTWLQNGKWKSPQRLNFPINSGADDFSFIVDKTIPRTKNISQISYFSSSRANDGRDAIYEYKKIQEAPLIVNKDDKNTQNSNLDIYLALKVYYKRFKNDNLAEALLGKFNLQGAFISIWSNGKKVLEGNTDKNGLLLTQLTLDTDYQIKISKDSFLNNQLILSTRNLKVDKDESVFTINKEVELERIYRGQEIVLENIYYDYEKWDITKNAEPTLNDLAQILIDNPLINIELGSHTDCRGTEDYNQILSQKRAQSAIDYLIKQGIDESRLIAKGYGESNPSLICQCESCSEEQHQKNRRTSFKIL
jgi:peptidoglycan-associated lipoprotein